MESCFYVSNQLLQGFRGFIENQDKFYKKFLR